MANLSYNYTNGGINNESNPDKFEGKEIVLENPQRRGYEFEGWYQESTYNNKVVRINGYGKAIITAKTVSG